MHILIIDVEATCWQGKTPPGQQSEIIEIGLCLLNQETLEPEGKRSILVKPQRSKVSEFCTELTTLTQEDVEQGVLFHEACQILQDEYQSEQLPWASWGNYDRIQFEKQCPSFGAPYPFSDQHTNVKKLFAQQYNLRRQVGMKRALQIMQRPLDGTHHRGHDDAWNIAHIYATILKKLGRK